MSTETTTAFINADQVEQMAAHYEAPAGFFDWLDLMKDLHSSHNPQSREDDEREAFETWYASGWKHNGFQRTHCGGEYLIAAVEQAWQGWKARAGLLAPQPSAAARDVLAERIRQITAEGMTTTGDDSYQAAELPRAAAAYTLNGANEEAPAIWPWAKAWWKPRDARANYVRAAALLLAEIERIDRQQSGSPVGLMSQAQNGGDQ